MFTNYNREIKLLPLLDFVCVLLTGYLAYVIRNNSYTLHDLHFLLLLVSGFLTITVFGFARVYLSSGTTWTHHIRQLFTPLLTVGLLILVIGFFSKSSEHFSRVATLLWFALCLITMIGYRMMISSLGKTRWFGSYLARRIVLFGESEDVMQLYQYLQQRQSPWLQITGIFSETGFSSDLSKLSVKSGKLDDLLEWSKDQRIDDLIAIPPPSGEQDEWFNCLKELQLIPANLNVGPNELLKLYPEARRIDIEELPLINLVHHPLSSLSRLFKTALDYTLALITLLTTLPLLTLIAIAIRLDSNGPILLRQQRLGFRNEVFTVFKFRTMRDGSQNDPMLPQAHPEDHRITRVGKLLRRFSLDELPQLLNVLNGSMSLVGPRPHAVPHNNKYAKLVDRYLERHKVKPGITGWAQVNGHRGATDSVEKMNLRVEHDLFYISNWSPLLDAEILFRTLVVVITGRNAY